MKDAWVGGAAATLVAIAGPAMAAEPEPPQCYDAYVVAEVVRQTPTVAPTCNDCIIMRWPWVVALDVRHVSRGHAPQGRVNVLTVQHTYMRTGQGFVRWWLRRNSDGGFNVIWPGEDEVPRRCGRDAGPAQPYHSLRPGETLHDLVRAGEREYGRTPR